MDDAELADRGARELGLLALVLDVGHEGRCEQAHDQHEARPQDDQAARALLARLLAPHLLDTCAPLCLLARAVNSLLRHRPPSDGVSPVLVLGGVYGRPEAVTGEMVSESDTVRSLCGRQPMRVSDQPHPLRGHDTVALLDRAAARAGSRRWARPAARTSAGPPGPPRGGPAGRSSRGRCRGRRPARPRARRGRTCPPTAAGPGSPPRTRGAPGGSTRSPRPRTTATGRPASLPATSSANPATSSTTAGAVTASSLP